MQADVSLSRIYNSKKCVAGLMINKIHTFVVHVLVSHMISNGPVISMIVEVILKGISLTKEN